MEKRLLATTILAGLAVCLSAASPGSAGQWPYDPSGNFYIKDGPPQGFEEIDHVALWKSQENDTWTKDSGVLGVNGDKFGFIKLNTTWKNAPPGRPFFEFETTTLRGIRYVFTGNFLDNRVFSQNITDPQTVIAEGKLVKFQDGVEAARAAVKFTYYARLWDKNAELLFAAGRGDLAAVKAFLAQGAKPDTLGPYGLTALEYAVGSGNSQVVKALLEAGAGMSAELSHKDFSSRLATYVPDDGRTALMHAARKKGSLEMVKLLLASGAEVNARDWTGRTALSHAAFNSPEIVRALIQAGAEVNVADDFGETPLMIFVDTRSEDKAALVNILLAAGVEVNAKNERGETALMGACYDEQLVKVVEALIRAGADVNARDRAGFTPLSIAEQAKNMETAELLRRAGAKN